LKILNRLATDVGLMLRRPPRQQYAALCYRLSKKNPEPEVLLLTSRDTGRWVIPKGWPMANKKAHAVAEQEAYEEAGVRGTVEKAPFGYYEYEKKLNSGVNVQGSGASARSFGDAGKLSRKTIQTSGMGQPPGGGKTRQRAGIESADARFRQTDDAFEIARPPRTWQCAVCFSNMAFIVFPFGKICEM
jgi:8-oxo-dGTP pyrophosphatase MutT (NUDIX family)